VGGLGFRHRTSERKCAHRHGASIAGRCGDNASSDRRLGDRVKEKKTSRRGCAANVSSAIDRFSPMVTKPMSFAPIANASPSAMAARSRYPLICRRATAALSVAVRKMYPVSGLTGVSASQFRRAVNRIAWCKGGHRHLQIEDDHDEIKFQSIGVESCKMELRSY
jgi:hypothetical protein